MVILIYFLSFQKQNNNCWEFYVIKKGLERVVTFKLEAFEPFILTEKQIKIMTTTLSTLKKSTKHALMYLQCSFSSRTNPFGVQKIIIIIISSSSSSISFSLFS